MQTQVSREVLRLLEGRGIKWEWCCSAVERPVENYSERQEDGCTRFWAEVPGCDRYVRVVVWPNGVFRTAHFDRGFRKRVTELRKRPTKGDPRIVGVDASSRKPKQVLHSTRWA
jgi:hypothetical protein